MGWEGCGGAGGMAAPMSAEHAPPPAAMRPAKKQPPKAVPEEKPEEPRVLTETKRATAAQKALRRRHAAKESYKSLSVGLTMLPRRAAIPFAPSKMMRSASLGSALAVQSAYWLSWRAACPQFTSDDVNAAD